MIDLEINRFHFSN